jgi:3-oxoadipyl-CoA thiolase
MRADDLAAFPITVLKERLSGADWSALDDVVLGCANQAGEDNRNVARMALLLAGLPERIPGTTVNRLCASGLEAVAAAGRAVRAGDAEFCLAGGVEHMTRAPMVMPKADAPFARKLEVYDTTIGWRFVNPRIKELYGVDAMGETAENVAQDFQISRADQDGYALRSQQRAAKAALAVSLSQDVAPVRYRTNEREKLVERDEHPRPDTTLEALANLRPAFRDNGSVTAGNAAGINDGAAALVVASEAAARRHGLVPRARIVGAGSAGVLPRVMGIGPVPATEKLLARLGLAIKNMDVIELNEAFASQVLAVVRQWGLADDAEHVNPNGGAIAIGHPLGMSGARLVQAAVGELHRRRGRYALVAMCVGVGQGAAMVLERI